MSSIQSAHDSRAHEADAEQGPRSPQHSASNTAHSDTPTRRSRQELVVMPAGPRPWLALGVMACIAASFGIISMLELGHRTTAIADPFTDLQVEAPPAAFEPAAARPISAAQESAFAASDDAEIQDAEIQDAKLASDQPTSRFSQFGGQLTAATAASDEPSEAPSPTAAEPGSVDEPEGHDEPSEEHMAADGVDQDGADQDGDDQGVFNQDVDDHDPLEPDAQAWSQDEEADAADPSDPGRPLTLADLPPIPASDMPPPPFAARNTPPSVKPASMPQVADDGAAAVEHEDDLEDGSYAQQAAEPPLENAFRLGGAADAIGPGRPPAAASTAAGSAFAAGGFDDPDAPIPVTPPSQASARAMPPAGVPGSGPAFTPPPAARYASSDAIRAFGGELPQRPAPPADTFAEPSEPPQASADGYGATGIGVPGPAILEGVQAPQVALEKRGPREVQVGKLARYEMLVRNVSSVVAHDVEIADLVPKGTTLVSTTPPAAPGIDGQLSWQIGSLEPGAQARVIVEVLPAEEGEVGSVASVRFAAKASVKSLATRPALAIDVTLPEPTRVGGDVPVTILVSNPGTGRATGVVLEGLLPAGLAHRAGQELEFDIGSLAPAETRSIDLLLASTGPGRHRVDLGLRADGQLEERLPVTIEVTAPTLELTAELPARRYLQRPATCVLSMANAGTASARSVELAAQLPPGLKFVSANNAGYYDEKTHRVLWQLEELPPAEIGSVEMVLMPIALGSQQIVAAARSPDGLSDQVTKVLEVEGVAALTFTVVDSEDPIEVEGVTEYVVRVGNQGTQAASNVQVMATILGDMQPVDASGPVDHRISNLTVTFEPLARLAPTEETVFRVRVRGKRAGDQRVQVQVTSADHPTPVSKEEITRVYADR